MKTLTVLLIGLVAITEAASDDEAILRAWNTFKVDYQKAYESEAEEKYRKNIFMEKMRRINLHNSKYEQGLVSFKLGINKYSDMLHDEFLRNMTGFNPVLLQDRKKHVGAEFAKLSLSIPQGAVDWRQQGAVSEVKSQRGCGACWAFAAAGALEGQYFRRHGQLIPLSAQHLIDCTTSYGNNGCKSGSMTAAFLYVMDNGIDAESAYPYKATKALVCYYDWQHIVTFASGFVNIAPGDEEGLKNAVFSIGPVAAAFHAISDSFDDYNSGIYYEPKCSPLRKKLNHAVLVVGYGTEGGKEYWLVKNSYGEDWGEKGYMKVARNQKNHCGIASLASYPTIYK